MNELLWGNGTRLLGILCSADTLLGSFRGEQLSPIPPAQSCLRARAVSQPSVAEETVYRSIEEDGLLPFFVIIPGRHLLSEVYKETKSVSAEGQENTTASSQGLGLEALSPGRVTHGPSGPCTSFSVPSRWPGLLFLSSVDYFPSSISLLASGN